MHARGRLGQRGEALAAAYLEQRGYEVVARNWRCRFGEIDLVAYDGQYVVIVEVRSRQGTRVGTPLESVDGRKRRRLVHLAQRFVHDAGVPAAPLRFDVIGIRFDLEPPRIEHVERAFDAGDW